MRDQFYAAFDLLRARLAPHRQAQAELHLRGEAGRRLLYKTRGEDRCLVIVEFAVQKHRAGSTVLQAAIEGAAVRLRPILMTSFAFIAGLIPLVFARGPGAIGNKTIGSAAAGGMLLGTIFGVLLIPGLYYIFAHMSERHIIVEDENENPLTEEIDHHEIS